MAHSVTWFQIQGKDGKKLHSFYKKMFAWRMQPAPGPGDLQMVEKEEDGISGGVGSSMDGNASVTVYITVSDVAAHLKKIESAGGKTVMPPMELPSNMGTIAGFSDPAGNWVGLWAPGSGMTAQPKQATAKKAPAKRAAKKATAKKAPAKKAPKKSAAPAKSAKKAKKAKKARKA